MIYTAKPEIFQSKFEVVSCFIENQKNILLLQRQDDKPQPNTYGIPAGKVNPKEYLRKAILREVLEETALDISTTRIFYLAKLYVKYQDYDFIYHTFSAGFDKRQKVIINQREHKNYIWAKPQDALNFPLIQDLDACIKIFYGL
jgi:8-oxo-dGTP diphosphatase